MKKNQVDIITMGCSKNLVDSETLLKLFEVNGYKCVHDSKNPQGEIVVVNTCGFIQDAKEESISTILELAEAKRKGKIKHLFVMGCLSERYSKELRDELPEVDKFYGKFNYKQLIEDLGKNRQPSCSYLRCLTTPHHYAYLKISEGCDRRCSYCAIPIITGKHKSRPVADIVDEVKMLVANGVKEIQVIAQELTYYGIDIDGKRHIAELISRISEVDGVEWIRLHYAYPTDFPQELIDVIRNKPNVCKYIDIALQHISDRVLKSMHRNVSKEETYALIEKLRREVPGIHIRTTLMVGFPGETEEDFNELLDFVKWARFERMGAFSYSEEDDTFSARNYQDDIPYEVKEERLSRLMALQQNISSEISASKIGNVYRVIIDRKEGDYYIGRTEYSSPDVDPEVLIPVAQKRLRSGCFYNVRITDSEEFDLYGEVL
ncbi:MAG: 30S ribosomal protein S12 methylthiotransferase RimO [Prevotella sp.]|nr:30S ribosomal protein S12 methylthiotransferase RimO [Prevotella sp.]